MPDSSPEDPFATRTTAAVNTDGIPASRRAARGATGPQSPAPGSDGSSAAETPSSAAPVTETDPGQATQPVSLSDEEHP